MFWVQAIQRLLSTAVFSLAIVIALQVQARAQASIFPQLVGVWNHLDSGHSIDVRDSGDVWSTGRPLARTSSTIDQGGNFAFEGQNSDGSGWRCVYYVTFLADKLRANWRFVSGERSNCRDGLYVKIKEAHLITDCDRFAASPSDPTRPIGIAGVVFNQIDAAKAIQACQVALTERPSDPRTAFQLGRAFHKAGDAASSAEAVRLYRKAADAGYVPAVYNLGLMYRIGRGVAKDQAEAIRLLRKGADAGNLDAIVSLGEMYRDGPGAANGDAEAVRLFRQGADLGDAGAMDNLASMYRDGWGVAKDDAEAIRWYRKAADAEDAHAMGNLGYMYELGVGVPSDVEEAVRWYRRAAAAGDEFAKNALKRLGR